MEERKDLERNVELSAESAERQHRLIESRGQQCLGWYHSHPFFEPTPSQTDIENHNGYARLFTQSNLPFMGIIVAPYFRILNPKKKDLRKPKLKEEEDGHTSDECSNISSAQNS